VSAPVSVLFVSHSLGPGGSERQLAALSRALDRTRFRAHAATVVDGCRAEEMRSDGIAVIDLPLRSYFGPSTLQAARALRNYIDRHEIKLVHTFDYSLSLFGVAVARSCGIAALSSQRFFMDSVPIKYRPVVLAAHWLAHGVVVNSEALRRYVHEQCKYPLHRINLCPNGIDARVFYPGNRARLGLMAECPLVVGSVSVLRKEKNLGHLIAAFARVRPSVPAAKLLIVGSGPEEEQLKDQAVRLGLQDACVFLPSTADVAPALRSIDIFVSPSLTEGMPNGVIEAMACGCMVIASRTGGTPELITHGVHGLLAHPNDLDDLVFQLRNAIDDLEGRQRMAAAAAHRAAAEFSILTAARRLEEIYKRYLGASAGGG